MRLVKEHWSLFLVLSLSFVVFTLILILKHEVQFQTFGLDLGFYDQIIFKASHFDFSKSTIAPIVDRHVKLSFFENDFHLPLLILAIIYSFVSTPYVLFIAQVLVAVVTVAVIYFASLAKIPSRFFAWSLAVTFLLSVPFQHVIFDGFIPEVFGALFLALFFYGVFSHNRRLSLIAAIGMIMSKVEFSPVVAISGLIVFLFEKEKRFGLNILFLGAVTFFLLVYVVNPYISPNYRNYAHYSLGYGTLGKNPQDVVVNFFTRPQAIVSATFSPAIKLNYLATQLTSFALIPIMGFQMLPLLLFEVFTRLGNNYMVAKWPLHSFTISTCLGIASIYSAKNFQKRINPTFLGIILLVTAVAQNLFFHGPINSLFKRQFYEIPSWSKANHQIMAKIPPNVSVAANNSLVPHLSERDKIYLLPEVADASYVIIDFHDNPNAFTPATREDLLAVVDRLLASQQYQEVAKIETTVLLKRL